MAIGWPLGKFNVKDRFVKDKGRGWWLGWVKNRRCAWSPHLSASYQMDMACLIIQRFNWIYKSFVRRAGAGGKNLDKNDNK